MEPIWTLPNLSFRPPGPWMTDFLHPVRDSGPADNEPAEPTRPHPPTTRAVLGCRPSGTQRQTPRFRRTRDPARHALPGAAHAPRTMRVEPGVAGRSHRRAPPFGVGGGAGGCRRPSPG